METEAEWVDAIGKPAYDSIEEMVAALQCDYERLEELKDEQDSLLEAVKDATEDGEQEAIEEAQAELDEWNEANGDELKDLLAAAGDCEDEEDARRRIEEDPLSLAVRSGWTSPGDDMKAEEFDLLLGTGGPAVRIIGELNEYGEPCKARLEVQDWFKPWTEYRPTDEDVLLAYCRCFYFGD